MQNPSKGHSPVLWTLVVISLLLNVVIIATLVVIVMAGRQMAADVSGQLESFGRQSISYRFHITQTIPVRANVPSHNSMVIPYSQNMPISTTAVVAKELPVIGLIQFDVPIQANIPISLSIPVEISQTNQVNTDVLVNLDIPLDIPIKGTPLKAMLDGIVKSLNQISGR